MSMPLVSVIMPCYNNASYVVAALESVLSQDYPNFEVIVVDDGSSDDSVSVLRQFGNRITLIQQANQGPAAARNNGIKAAKGKYIAFNDSDDFWLPGKLSAQITYLEQNPDIGLCYCHWAVWDSPVTFKEISDRYSYKDQLLKTDPNYTGWLYLKLLKDSIIHTITAVIRRSVLDDIGLFNANYRIGEDHDLWLRISQKYRIAKLNNVFAIYRDNPTSITKGVHSQNFSLVVLQTALNNYGLSCPSGEKISQSLVNSYLGARHFSYGYNAMIKGHRDKALKSFQGCISCKYRLSKALVFWFICALPPVYHLFLKRKNAQVLANQ
ncbi:glycosyltransferase [Arsukibacterium sp.]|uniref:glycosyltransferase n=1 Tax=Arsukibacterium sp. TaxID=1977258 RepID=UPI001BD39FBC|nr:glycosyltransferase [Arsukibacterium sp.]